MEFCTYNIEGLISFKSKLFEDDRGHFFESYNKEQLKRFLGDMEFVQTNQSLSKKNVLRGLHFQRPPHGQGKLVRVISGAVIDIAVDIRKGSRTYGQHIKVELSGKNRSNFWIPEGFAHGFLSLEENTVFSYKCSKAYHAASEDAIDWNDPSLAIDWEVIDPIVSEKDAMAQGFNDFNSPFDL